MNKINLTINELNGMLFTLVEQGSLYINHVHRKQVEEFLKDRNIKTYTEEWPEYVIILPVIKGK